jgi:hypothetical protein
MSFNVSVVTDLLQSETVAALAHKNSDKQGDDSGLESGHTSMNNGKHFKVRIEEKKEKSTKITENALMDKL